MPAKPAIDLTAADKAIKLHNPRITIKPIKTQTDYEAVASILVEVKDHLKALKKDSDEIIRPIRTGLDKLYAKFRDQRRKLEALETQASDAINAWTAKLQAKEVKKAERKAAKVENDEVAEDMIEAAKTKAVAPKVAGLQTRTDYEITITDRLAVPDDFMGITLKIVDLPAIKKLVKATKGKVEIPGVAIKQVQKVGGARR